MVSSGDRYNYGDLLFPIVTSWALRSAGYPTISYGLRRSDLSGFGALPSRGIKDLYRDAEDGDVVLLAGGENLAQRWFDMHLTLLGAEGAQSLVRFQQRFGIGMAQRRSRWQLCARQEFPYIISPDRFRAKVRVMYNSMGGWPLRDYPAKDQRSIVRDLAKASFLSVREEESAAILRELDATLPVSVAPDCVFLLPEMLSREELRRKASPGVRKLVSEAGEYFCFQCQCRYGAAHRGELARQLRALAGRCGWNILLTPIGRIFSLEDDVFLESLSAELGGAPMLPASAGIYDVAYALASARLFCGTSLHGMVTALTYEVPFVPLANDDPKVGNNVRSWGLEEAFPSAAVEELASHGERCLRWTGAFLAEHAERLRRAAGENMQCLAERILA